MRLYPPDQSEPQGRRPGSQKFLGRSAGKGDANDSCHPEGATPLGPYFPCPQPLCCEVLEAQIEWKGAVGDPHLGEVMPGYKRSVIRLIEALA